MKKVLSLFLLFFGLLHAEPIVIATEVPDVVIKDIDGKEYDVHALLDAGHYLAFYYCSST